MPKKKKRRGRKKEEEGERERVFRWSVGVKWWGWISEIIINK